ncbi:hypothetical protein AVEN_59460-1 [Araneus ventricosus]|uniref:Uncharacterized protein n=1 Tax=Araneus ventricosus TaxID=182803 RepID=A0A4Y2N615_ARAVE|nr:hypothetical protein AVEN_59460-1 [Araneus ventricosus]
MDELMKIPRNIQEVYIPYTRSIHSLYKKYTFPIQEVQGLIEQYPVIVSRHFMIRVGALMKFIKAPIIAKFLEVSWMTIGGELNSRIEEIHTYIWLYGLKMHQKELNKSIVYAHASFHLKIQS